MSNFIGGILAMLVAPFMNWLYAKIQQGVQAELAAQKKKEEIEKANAAVAAQTVAAQSDKERDDAAANLVSHL